MKGVENLPKPEETKARKWALEGRGHNRSTGALRVWVDSERWEAHAMTMALDLRGDEGAEVCTERSTMMREGEVEDGVAQRGYGTNETGGDADREDEGDKLLVDGGVGGTEGYNGRALHVANVFEFTAGGDELIDPRGGNDASDIDVNAGGSEDFDGDRGGNGEGVPVNNGGEASEPISEGDLFGGGSGALRNENEGSAGMAGNGFDSGEGSGRDGREETGGTAFSGEDGSEKGRDIVKEEAQEVHDATQRRDGFDIP